MWVYNRRASEAVASLRSTLKIQSVDPAESIDEKRPSVASYLRAEFMHALHPNEDNHNDPLLAHSADLLLHSASTSHANVPQDEAPTGQAVRVSSTAAESSDSRPVNSEQNPSLSSADHSTPETTDPRAHSTVQNPYSLNPNLSNYWVSGLNGSFPALPPDQLTEYYSIGKTQPFIGDIMVPGSAAEAFEKCSFKKEAIIMCTDVGDIWFEFVFGQVMMMKERGYAHIIIYMDNRKHCEQFQS